MTVLDLATKSNDGLELIRRRPTGWQTPDGRYVVLEWHRGEWLAYDTHQPTITHPLGTLLARAGTRAGVTKRLSWVLNGTYDGPIPCEVG